MKTVQLKLFDTLVVLDI